MTHETGITCQLNMGYRTRKHFNKVWGRKVAKEIATMRKEKKMKMRVTDILRRLYGQSIIAN